MSFQAYIDTIRTKTGKSPADWRAWANAKGYIKDGALRPDVKAGTVTADLKAEYDLGHGHAMAIVAVLKNSRHAEGAI